MAEFLVELYVSKADAATVARSADRARSAAEQLTQEGIPVRWLRSIFVAEDETCLFLYEAESADAVRDAATRAALAFERIADVVVDLHAGSRDEAPVASSPALEALTRKETT